MSKISNRIKKYAIHNFDSHMDQSLFLSILNKNQTKQTVIEQDPDTKLCQTHARFIYYNEKPQQPAHRTSRNSVNSQNKNGKEGEQANQDIGHDFSVNSLAREEGVRNNNKIKSKYKRFIELTNYNKEVSEKSLNVDHRIDRLRKVKQEEQKNKNNQNTRSHFFSRPQLNGMKYNSLHSKKNESGFRRDRQNGNGYIPIGYNGQILQKKVSKVSELAKYNTHFVDMEISVDPETIFQGSDSKQNNVKKENVVLNIFEKARQRKTNQILNSKNAYYAIFRAPAKKIPQEQKKIQFERKLQNFINNSQNEKVQITLRQLMQFKQIVYRKREQQYFLAQKQSSQEQNKKKTSENQKIEPAGSMKQMIKKPQVNIQNFKNYAQLISSAQLSQQFGKNVHKQDKIKKKNIEVKFNTSRGPSKNKMGNSLNLRSKTSRKEKQKQKQKQKGMSRNQESDHHRSIHIL